MDETAGILAQPETGSPAIAAETEAIELLLQSKRINPQGRRRRRLARPAAAATARRTTRPWPCSAAASTTRKSAKTAASRRRRASRARRLPEEFRAGLDEYFNRLERGSDTN